MKKSNVVILVLAILSLIAIIGYNVYISLEDAVTKRRSDLDTLNDISGSSTNDSSGTISVSNDLKEELLNIVPLYKDSDAYTGGTRTLSNVKPAMLYKAFKYIKNNNLYITKNLTLRNMCASKYGSENKCIMYVSVENLDNYLSKNYNTSVSNINISNITFEDTSEIFEKLSDEYYVTLTNELTSELVKITLSSKSFKYNSNVIIEEKVLFTVKDASGYHNLYKTSNIDDDNIVLNKVFALDEDLNEIVKKYSSKASTYEHTFEKNSTNYNWVKTIKK